MGGDERFDLLFLLLKATSFGAKLAKLAYTTSIHCTGISKGLEYHIADVKRLNCDDSPKFGELVYITPEFTELECAQQVSINNQLILLCLLGATAASSDRLHGRLCRAYFT